MINELYVNTVTDLCLRQQRNLHIKFTCSSYQRLLKQIENLSNVRGELRNAFYIAGIKLDSSSRVRRGIFDFVGEIRKTLFGTLDTSDATYYNNELDRLYNDQKSIIHYVKNQTSIILNAININNEILNKSRDQIQRVNEQFNKVRDLSKTNELNICRY